MKLNILLGTGCNLSCAYCLQDKSKSPYPPDDFDEFAQGLADKIGPQPVSVNFWGGEPFLYWQRIVKLMDSMSRIGMDVTGVRMNTNGTLLTNDIVDQLNEWDAHIVISRHQPGLINWDAAKHLMRSSIAYLFTADNWNVWPWRDWHLWHCHDHDRWWFPYLQWPHAVGKGSDHFFNEDTIKDHITHLWLTFKMYGSGDEFIDSMWDSQLAQWRARQEAPLNPRCKGPHVLSVDLGLNEMSCHHNPTADFPALIHDSCRSCHALKWCRSGCPISTQRELECLLIKAQDKILTELNKCTS